MTPIPRTVKRKEHAQSSGKAYCSFFRRSPESLCDMIYRRAIGKGRSFTRRASLMLRTRLAAESPPFMKRRDIDVGDVDKVFSSRWRDGNVILAGTKCNRLLAIRLDTNVVHDIPLIPATEERPDIGRGGIHGMDIDPNRQYLATGGTNENTINVFDLETLTPRITFSGAHSNWVFEMRWLSEDRLVSCSRDGTLAIWSMENYLNNRDRLDVHGATIKERYFFDKPLTVKTWKAASDECVILRTMTYSPDADRLCVVTGRKELDVVDVAGDLSVVRTISMQPCCQEAVTAAYNPLDPWETAVGSQAHVTIYDIRNSQPMVRSFRSKHQTYGVRSVQYNNQMLSYSTGRGSIFFYDVRAGRHLDLNSKAFSVGLGKPFMDEVRQTVNLSSATASFVAIYTHEYDHSRTRMFCAGGPLSAAEIGNFASLWW